MPVDEPTGASTAVGGHPAPASSGRVARRRDQRVSAILTAAAEVLAERGYRGFVLEEVAERVDLTEASLYHYFPSRDELVGSCLEFLGDSLNHELREVVAEHPGGAGEQLRSLVVAHLELTTWSRPEMARLFLQPLELPAPLRARIRRLRREHDAIFREVVRRGVASGEFAGTAVDDDVALHNLYGAVNHVPTWFRGRRRRDFDDVSHAVAVNVLRLFRAED